MVSRLRHIIPICGVAFAAFFNLSAAELVLAERGQPTECRIVVPANPAPVFGYAAEELRDWTEKLVGVRLAIETNTTPAKAIYLGGVTEEASGTDGFRIKVEGESVRVLGVGDARGVLYGVYELLETYGGIGWFASWHTVVPKADRFAIPATLDVRETPAFPFREPFDYDINRHPAFAARLRRNCVTWGVLIPPRMGGLARRPAKVLKGHTADILCPVAKHFDAHPEWFSEISGQRVREKTQLCLTNPELIAFVTSNFVEQVKADPEASGYSFGNNDWYNCCTCPNCKAVNDAEGTQAGTTIRMCNILAEELERIAPGKTVKAPAYQYTRRPPNLTRPRDNVLVDFAPIESDYSMPMNESPNAESRQICEDIRGWGRIASKAGLYVFDYVTNFESYYSPFPNVLTLQGNVRFFRDNQVKILYEEGAHTTPHAAFAELKTWLLAKLMWNPDLDVQAAIDRFLKGFYGPSAAPFVRKYFDALHALPRDPTKRKLGIMESFESPVYTDEFLWESLSTWNDAEKAARADGPAYVRHVRWGAMSPAAMILQREGAGVCVKRTAYPDVRIRTLAKWMVERMDEIGPDFLIGEGMTARTKTLRARWTRLADPAQAIAPSDRAVAEVEDVFNIWSGFGAKAVDEPKASGGRAIRLPNGYAGNWILYMPMGTFGYDAGERYRLRLRVRVDRKDGSPLGPMFEAGIERAGVKARFDTAADSEDYRWYDIGEWTPAKGQQIYVAPGTFDKSKSAANPAFEALWIDQVEFEKVRGVSATTSRNCTLDGSGANDILSYTQRKERKHLT